MAVELISPQLQNRIKDSVQKVGKEGVGRPRELEIVGIELDNEAGTFTSMLKEAIYSVDATQKAAGARVEDVVTGKSDNIHEVMIAMEKAKVSFQMMLEIRNRAVETYQELSRMQI